MKKRHWNLRAAVVCGVIACACWMGGSVSNAQTQPADLSPALAHVVNLSKGGMSDDFILTYIKNSGTAYTLSDEDMIYLHKEGVSENVIKALMNTGSASPAPAQPAAGASPANASPTPDTSAASPAPPPLDQPAPATAGQSASPAPPDVAPEQSAAPVQAALQDNFFGDAGLNSSLWETQSPVLQGLASMDGFQVMPALAFSPSGMQMSGIAAHGQFMGIQSLAGFSPPFNFNVTVSGLTPRAVPFEVYLVSSDLQQWVSVAGHLGGRGINGPRVFFFGGVVAAPGAGNEPEYGVWINHTGSGFPISALGERLANDPIPGVAYSVQISAGADGMASVSLLDPSGNALGSQNVQIGMGPFNVVLAGRNGPTYAVWQSVQLTPTAPAVVEAPAPPPVPTLDYFQAQLAPYGNWVNVPGCGVCWQPALDPSTQATWRPYYDGGHWENTDAGWYWQSDYPWGDITFHYGRWAYVSLAEDPCWVWVPGYDYAPSWVVWRHADDDGYVGWAPLPPGAVFMDGGWIYNGAPVAADFDFGIAMGFYTFVGYDHFWEHDFRGFIVPQDRLAYFYGHSVFENHFRRDEHGRFFNEGLRRDRMAALTHHEIRAKSARDLRDREERRNVEARRDDIRSYKTGGQKPGAIRSADRRSESGNRNGSERTGETSHNGGNGQAGHNGTEQNKSTMGGQSGGRPSSGGMGGAPKTTSGAGGQKPSGGGSKPASSGKSEEKKKN